MSEAEVEDDDEGEEDGAGAAVEDLDGDATWVVDDLGGIEVDVG